MSVDSFQLRQFLQQYRRNGKICELRELPLADIQRIPETWQRIVSLSGSARLDATMEAWSLHAPGLINVGKYLERNLVSVDLVYHESLCFVHEESPPVQSFPVGYCLMYGLQKGGAGPLVFYEARNPKSMRSWPALEKVWGHLPKSVLDFYRFHNGFAYSPLMTMGLSPVEGMFFLDEYEWGILESLGELPFNLNDQLAIFHNGMGDSICVSVADPNASAVIWFKADNPMLNNGLWPVVDAWTVLGMET